MDYKSDLGPDQRAVVLALRDNTWVRGIEGRVHELANHALQTVSLLPPTLTYLEYSQQPALSRDGRSSQA